MAASYAMIGIPKTLEDALRDRLVVPFVGAGVSMSVKNRTGSSALPSWCALLSGAAVRLRADGKQPEADVVEGLLHKRHPDYFEAAKQAREGMGPGWYRYLREVLDPPRDRIEPGSLSLARAVWQLPSKLLVTTNYDQILRYALDEGNDMVQLNVTATAELPAMLRDRIDRPTVWHLHGHIHDAQRLILTPDGYRELYPSQEDEVRYHAALQALRHLLAARTFLFVGFSLDDEQFSNQISWVHQAFGGAIGPHYMLVPVHELRETQRRLKGFDCIEFLPFDGFGEPLVKRVEELASAGKTERHVAGPVATEVPAPVVPSAPSAATPELPQFPAGTEALDMLEVRRSYRLVYEYQRRLFDRLRELSDTLTGGMGFAFRRWDPTLYSRHAKSTTEFFDYSHWAWDFLPAYRLQLVWESPGAGRNTSRSVVIEAVSDTGFNQVGRYEPHPSQFDDVVASRSELQVNLMRSTDPNLSWSQAWLLLSQHENVIYDGKDHVVSAGDNQCTYRYFSVDLNVVLDAEGLREHVTLPLRSWFGYSS